MKTTKRDFELFKDNFIKWQHKLGIIDWSLHFTHELVEGDYARTYYVLSGAVATVHLSTEWDDMRPKNDETIDRLALHETLHLLIAPLVAEAGARYTNQEAIDVAEHSIIRRLENTII